MNTCRKIKKSNKIWQNKNIIYTIVGFYNLILNKDECKIWCSNGDAWQIPRRNA